MKEIIIIALILALIYLYYQQRKLNGLGNKITSEIKEVDQNLNSFNQDLSNFLGSKDFEELKTKLDGKTLDELLEANEDYETEVDTLTRTKNSLEADLLAQSNAFQSRLREKDRENKKLKEDLTSEKQQHKGSLERIVKLTEQKTELEKEHQEQLRKINLLFDEKKEEVD